MMAETTNFQMIRELLDARASVNDAHFENILRELDHGFKGVHGRLDRVNGRLDKQEDRIVVLEDTDRAHAHRRITDQDSTPHARAEDSKPITRRDVVVASSAATVAITAILLVFKISGVLP